LGEQTESLYEEATMELTVGGLNNATKTSITVVFSVVTSCSLAGDHNMLKEHTASIFSVEDYRKSTVITQKTML
jgi:hypothetical protein